MGGSIWPDYMGHFPPDFSLIANSGQSDHLFCIQLLRLRCKNVCSICFGKGVHFAPESGIPFTPEQDAHFSGISR